MTTSVGVRSACPGNAEPYALISAAMSFSLWRAISAASSRVIDMDEVRKRKANFLGYPPLDGASCSDIFLFPISRWTIRLQRSLRKLADPIKKPIPNGHTSSMKNPPASLGIVTSCPNPLMIPIVKMSSSPTAMIAQNLVINTQIASHGKDTSSSVNCCRFERNLAACFKVDSCLYLTNV